MCIIKDVCMYYKCVWLLLGLSKWWKVCGWRAASSVDSVAKTSVKKMRAEADWAERTLAIKGEMKTNGHMIGRGDGKQMRGWCVGWQLGHWLITTPSPSQDLYRLSVLVWMACLSTTLPFTKHTHIHTTLLYVTIYYYLKSLTSDIITDIRYVSNTGKFYHSLMDWLHMQRDYFLWPSPNSRGILCYSSTGLSINWYWPNHIRLQPTPLGQRETTGQRTGESKCRSRWRGNSSLKISQQHLPLADQSSIAIWSLFN